MLELRIVKLSIYYFLKGKLDDSGWGSTGYYNNDVVMLMDAYPSDEDLKKIVAEPSGMSDSEIVLPIVAMEMANQGHRPLELGSKDATVRLFSISILGREKAETEDLAQQVYEWLEFNNIELKNYNMGFPPDIDPSVVGTIDTENLSMVPIRIIGSPDISDKHRYEITFNAVTYLTSGSEEDIPV